MKRESEEELAKLQKEFKRKLLKLTQKDSELQSIRDKLAEARRMAKDAQAKCDHEKEAFQVEKEALLRDLE